MRELFIPNPAPAELAEALFNCEVFAICEDSCPYRHLRGKGCSGFLMQHSSQAITDLLKQIEALIEENKRLREELRWIPTAERLPTVEDAVNGHVYAFSKDTKTGGKWPWESIGNNPDWFTHWMHLPKGPEAE